MRVLLLNTETKLYYAGGHQWTADTTKAMVFDEIARAAQVYANDNLTYAEIIIEEPSKEAPNSPEHSEAAH